MQNRNIFQANNAQQVAGELLSLLTQGPNLLKMREHLHELHDVYLRHKLESKEFSDVQYFELFESYNHLLLIVNTVLDECFDVKTEKRGAA